MEEENLNREHKIKKGGKEDGKGDVKIDLRNLGGQDIGEYLVTDGTTHTLCSPYRPDGVEISDGLLRAALRDHTDMTMVDLAMVLMSPCER